MGAAGPPLHQRGGPGASNVAASPAAGAAEGSRAAAPVRRCAEKSPVPSARLAEAGARAALTLDVVAGQPRLTDVPAGRTPAADPRGIGRPARPLRPFPGQN
ncbi:hypothetical protein ACWD0J_13535 [Streptomyces sp. NPDC003011]